MSYIFEVSLNIYLNQKKDESNPIFFVKSIVNSKDLFCSNVR